MRGGNERGCEREEVLDSFDEALFIEDLKGNVIFVNSAAERIYGYTKEELMKMGLNTIVPQEEMRKHGEIVKSLIKNGRIRFRAYNMRRDGTRFPVEIYASIIPHHEELVLIRVSDLSARVFEDKILEMVGEFGGEAIVATDSEGKVLWWNREAERLFGYRREEIVGKRFYNYIMKDREKFRKMAEKLKSMETITPLTRTAITEMKRKDGTVFKAEVKHTIFSADDVKYTITIIRDITERINYEKLLKEEREKYRNIIENMINAVVIIQDEKVIYVNREFEKLSQYPRDEILGKKFLILIQEEARALVLENYLARMKGLPVPEEYILPLRKKDGTSIWGLIKANRILYDGRYADLISIVDITELKNREEKLLVINDMVKLLNREESKWGMFKIIVDTLHRYLNFEHVAVAEVVDDYIVAVEMRGEYTKKVKIPINGERGVAPLAVKFNRSYYVPDTRKEKRYIPGIKGGRCEYVVPISTGKKVYGVIEIERKEVNSIDNYDRFLVDIIASHLALALSRWEQEVKLRESKEMQRLMLHIVSHDLRTPLAVIEGYAEFLEEEGVKEYGKEIRRAVDVATEIIDQAKFLSRLDMGEIDSVMEKFDLKHLMEDISQHVLKKHPGGEVKVRGRRYTIAGYKLLIGEVFMNLMDNAFKYGASRVDVKIRKNKDWLIIRVEDDGIGISDERKEKIFKPFVKYGSGGAGLGLSIVKKIVDMHNGRIWIEDNQPRGSVFVIEIPIL